MESDFILSANLRESSYGSEEWRSAKDYISKSGMVLLKQSPAHYKEREPFIETPEILFGKMYHEYIFQEEKFKSDYFVFDDSEIINFLKEKGAKSPKATNEYKHWYGTQIEQAGNKILVSFDDNERLKGMKARLMSHPYAKMLITHGKPEQAIIGELETKAGNIGVKLIPDNRYDEKHVCVELKTTVRASKIDFPREAVNYDYHIQAAFYKDMLELFYNDARPVRFIFIAQEKKLPFAFNIFEADPQFLGQGRYEYEMLLQLYKYCLDNDFWPGYQVWCENKYGLNEIKMPAWSIHPMDYFIYK